MTQAKDGDKVKVHYTGKFDDGTVFDRTEEHKPLQFTIGERKILPTFEQAVVGMNPGESKTLRISADRAYGPRRDEMVLVVERSRVPGHIEPTVGQQLQLRQPDGQLGVVTVTKVSDTEVTLDANHPLAGKDLLFEIQLLEVA